MVKSISAKYGPATIVAPEIDSAQNDRSDPKQTTVASWEDVQYSVNLVRSSFSDVLGLVVLSRRGKKEAGHAPREGSEQDREEGPQPETEIDEKQTEHTEVER